MHGTNWERHGSVAIGKGTASAVPLRARQTRGFSR